MATPTRDLAEETRRRVEQLCIAFRAEVERAIAMDSKRRLEVHAVAVVEGRSVTRDTHVDPARTYPLGDRNGTD